MTITAAKARKLSAESVKEFKKSKSFSDIISSLERVIKNAVDTGKRSVTCLMGIQKKTNGDSLTENEWQVVIDELIANGFEYDEYTEKNCSFYTISW